MVTGDSLIVAKHVSKRVGIAVEHCVEGPQLALMDREQFSAAVVDGTVFARCTPHQKLQIVSQLQVRCREQPHHRHEGVALGGSCCCLLACKNMPVVHGGWQKSVQEVRASQPGVVRSRSVPSGACRPCCRQVLPAAAVACSHLLHDLSWLGLSSAPACPIVTSDAGTVKGP